MKDQALTVRARRLSEPAPEFNHRFTRRDTAPGSPRLDAFAISPGGRLRDQAGSARVASAARGNNKVTVVPSPGLLASVASPPLCLAKP